MSTLTKQERESLLKRLMDEYGEDEETWTALRSFRRLTTDVEGIVSSHLAEQRKQIAKEIMAQMPPYKAYPNNAVYREATLNAARIARGGDQ